MNERIEKLMEQTGIHVYKRSVLDKHYPELYDGVYCELSVEELEKFAELIVKECADIADRRPNVLINQTVGGWIKQHFGVES